MFMDVYGDGNWSCSTCESFRGRSIFLDYEHGSSVFSCLELYVGTPATGFEILVSWNHRFATPDCLRIRFPSLDRFGRICWNLRLLYGDVWTCSSFRNLDMMKCYFGHFCTMFRKQIKQTQLRGCEMDEVLRVHTCI